MNKDSLRSFWERSRTPYFHIGLGVFLVTVCLALFVQCLLLPHIFPAWHGGNGLLAGTDSLRFHELALDMSTRIQQHGWAEWELRPEGQSPAGIAAIFYTLIYPMPWVMIPLNAIIHTAAVLILLRIMLFFLPKWQQALLTVLPFAFYPSAMIWYTQIHKDGFSILGFMLFLLGWLLIIKSHQQRAQINLLWRGCAAVIAGSICVWIVRPYLVEVMQLAAIVLLFLILLYIFVAFVRRRVSLVSTIGYISIVLLLVAFMTPFRSVSPSIVVVSIAQRVQQFGYDLFRSQPLEPVVNNGPLVIPPKCEPWQYVEWLPDGVNEKICSFARTRDGFTRGYVDARSNIDVDVFYMSLTDIVLYLPRSAEIVFLAPFPADWFKSGSLAANTVMRRISAFEMIGIYVSLLLLPVGVKVWGRRLEFWMVLLLCSTNMVIYALIVANVGTLYRMRYGFIMTMVALGMAAAIRFIAERRDAASITGDASVERV